MVTSSNSLDLLAAALQRAGRSEESEEDRPLYRRFGAYTPASTARLYGPTGLLAGETPPGGTGSARVVRVGDKTIHDGGRVIDLSIRDDAIYKRKNDPPEKETSLLEEIKKSRSQKDIKSYHESENSILGLPFIQQNQNPYLDNKKEEDSPVIKRKSPILAMTESGEDK